MRARKASLLWKLEATYGVDPTPAAGANTIEVDNLNVVPIAADNVSRERVRTFFGNSEMLQAARWKEISFSVPIAGAGAAGTAPKWGALLRSCGMGETVTGGVKVEYKHVSSGEESGCGYCNYDGRLEKILGARGTYTMNFRTRQRPTFDFSFIGLFAAITDAALPAIDLSAWIKPVAVNNGNTTTFTLHGYAAKLLDFTLTGNVEREYRNLVGLEQVDFLDRAPAASVTIEPPTIAAKDYFSIVNTQATGVLQLIHGPATNQVQIDMAAAQLITPQNSPQGKLRYDQIGVHPVATAEGNDITITAL